jgi:hypothetical protein
VLRGRAEHGRCLLAFDETGARHATGTAMVVHAGFLGTLRVGAGSERNDQDHGEHEQN